jgi:hypothetical protein
MRHGTPIAMKTKWAPHPVALWGRQSWRQPPLQAAFYRLSKSLRKGRLPPKLSAPQESLPSMFSRVSMRAFVTPVDGIETSLDAARTSACAASR